MRPLALALLLCLPAAAESDPFERLERLLPVAVNRDAVSAVFKHLMSQGGRQEIDGDMPERSSGALRAKRHLAAGLIGEGRGPDMSDALLRYQAVRVVEKLEVRTGDGRIRLTTRIFVVDSGARLIEVREAHATGNPALGPGGLDAATALEPVSPAERKDEWEQIAREVLTLPRLKT